MQATIKEDVVQFVDDDEKVDVMEFDNDEKDVVYGTSQQHVPQHRRSSVWMNALEVLPVRLGGGGQDGLVGIGVDVAVALGLRAGDNDNHEEENSLSSSSSSSNEEESDNDNHEEEEENEEEIPPLGSIWETISTNIQACFNIDRVAREWRGKWSPNLASSALQVKAPWGRRAWLGGEAVFLSAVQDLFEAHEFPSGAEVSLMVCEATWDFKITVTISTEKYEGWKEAGYIPEKVFLAGLKAIEGVHLVETQTFTLTDPKQKKKKGVLKF